MAVKYNTKTADPSKIPDTFKTLFSGKAAATYINLNNNNEKIEKRGLFESSSDVEKGDIFVSELKGISRRSSFRSYVQIAACITIVILTLTVSTQVALEGKNLFDYLNSNAALPPMDSEVPPQAIMDLAGFVSAKSKSINSAMDLQHIKGARELNIQYLVEESPEETQILVPALDKESVHAIEATGPTSEDWLQFVVETFSEAEDLTLNIDQLCIGSKVRDRSSLNPLTAPNVQDLTLETAYLCPLMQWVFNWEMPNIKRVTINDAYLTQQDFESLSRFLERNKESLDSITVKKSIFCTDCDFSHEIMMEMDVIVLEQVVQPDYPDFE